MLSIRCRHRLSLIYFFLSFHPLCVYLSVLRFLATPCILPLRNDGIAQWIFSTEIPDVNFVFFFFFFSFYFVTFYCCCFESFRKRSRFGSTKKEIDVRVSRFLFVSLFMSRLEFSQIVESICRWLVYIAWQSKPSVFFFFFFFFLCGRYTNIWIKLNQSSWIGTRLYCLLSGLIAVPRRDDSRNCCSFNGSGSLWIG